MIRERGAVEALLFVGLGGRRDHQLAALQAKFLYELFGLAQICFLFQATARPSDNPIQRTRLLSSPAAGPIPADYGPVVVKSLP